MEEVFIAIMEQIAQEMPELSLIDEDYGQLEMGAEEDQLYKSLQCLQCTDNASPLVREKSRSYAMPHYIKVYEMTFSFTLHDESAMPSSYGE